MSNFRKCVLIIMMLFAANLAATSAFARAGGGGSFHGGGGGGGFSGGGSWGGGGGGSWSFGGRSNSPSGNLSAMDILIIVVVLAFIIFYQYLKMRSQTGYSASDGSPYDPPTFTSTLRLNPQPSESDVIDALQKSDPTFDAASFYTRLRAAFLALQEAWSTQNLDTVRPFISDGILERFSLQFDEQRFLGYRDLMKNVTIQSIQLVQVVSDHLYDTATVRIHASAVDINVNADGSMRSGSLAAEPFTEYWSFLRKRGAASITNGLIEGHCPNCGAAVEINQNANCPNCKASLRNGQYDWVLTEITQADEWQKTSAAAITGLSDMLAHDPNFTTADLEDRASVMFWRLNLADRLASVDPIRKIAVPAFVERYPVKFSPDISGNRRCYLDAGVGAVNTLAVVPGDPANGTSDHALVEIRWSGIIYTLSPSGAPHRTTTDNLIYSWYVLKRNAGALTDPEKAISSAHCPNCGAPLSRTTSNACEYCKTILTDGTHGWLLDHITPRNDTEVKAWLTRHAAAP